MAYYTPEQLTLYFDRIGYPQTLYAVDDWLVFLQQLIQHQLTSIPFETLSLHYSVEKTVSLNPDDLFWKLVTRRRGGYCQENNTFFGIVLRSLGFSVYGVICRSSNASRGMVGDGWRAMSHMANVVTVDGTRYMVDVGYGPNGPIVPIPLSSASTSTTKAPQPAIVPGMPCQQLRLEYKNLPQHSSAEQGVWVYSQKLQSDPLGGGCSDMWMELYHFPDVEFFLPDFDVLNHYNSTMGHWTRTVIAQRFVWNDGAGGNVGKGERLIVGSVVLLNDRVETRRAGEGRGMLVQEFKTEAERVEALEREFGIVLSEDERNGIVGHMSELVSPPLK